jgi:4-diphosphocytidyl-2-C-methyl-D-erythritol kinase
MKQKSYAKVNIFLKIVGKNGDYHDIASRFVLVKNLFDTVSFEPKKDSSKARFDIIGDFDCILEDNIIYKAYQKLSVLYPQVVEFFQNYDVVVDKKIPTFAGLGGGSSNCATFLNMCNRYLKLDISTDELSKIGVSLGADVPFFVYGYSSANVSGIGDIVEEFIEDSLDIQTITPDIKCSTKDIFTTFRDRFYSEISKDEQQLLFGLRSKEILDRYDIYYLNDLYKSVLSNYSQFKSIYQELAEDKKIFFSGSGSSFFWIK